MPIITDCIGQNGENTIFRVKQMITIGNYAATAAFPAMAGLGLCMRVRLEPPAHILLCSYDASI